MRLGVNPEDAYAGSRTQLGGWRVAQSPILKTTITSARMKEGGYVTILELYHQIRPK
jgi:RNA-directed DNA polymerase